MFFSQSALDVFAVGISLGESWLRSASWMVFPPGEAAMSRINGCGQLVKVKQFHRQHGCGFLDIKITQAVFNRIARCGLGFHPESGRAKGNLGEMPAIQLPQIFFQFPELDV